MLAATQKGTPPLTRFIETADVPSPMSRSSRSLSSSAGRDGSNGNSGRSGSDGNSDRMLLQGAVSGTASGSNWLQQQQPADLLSGQLRLNPSAEVYTPTQTLGYASLPSGLASLHRQGTNRPGNPSRVASAAAGAQVISEESGRLTTDWRGTGTTGPTGATSEYLSFFEGGDASRQVGPPVRLRLCCHAFVL